MEIKYYLTLIFTLFLFAVSSSQQKLKVKLIEFSDHKIPSYCGYNKQYGVLKLELLDASSTFKKGEHLFIYQECPREVMNEYVGKYSNNEIYLLNLRGKINEQLLNSAEKLRKMYYKNENSGIIYSGWLEKNNNQ
jgi:hypothetical protein